MLGCLPRPIGDELLYSMLARYRELSASTTSKLTMDAAFGGNGRYANVSLPGRLRNVGKLNGPWRPALDDYARNLFELMVRSVPGKAMFPVRGRGWPEHAPIPAAPDLDRLDAIQLPRGRKRGAFGKNP